VLNVSL